MVRGEGERFPAAARTEGDAAVEEEAREAEGVLRLRAQLHLLLDARLSPACRGRGRVLRRQSGRTLSLRIGSEAKTGCTRRSWDNALSPRLRDRP